jgi:hypothetical protein
LKKKKQKKLLDVGLSLSGGVRQCPRVFWFFFSKKNFFLPKANVARGADKKSALRRGVMA